MGKTAFIFIILIVLAGVVLFTRTERKEAPTEPISVSATAVLNTTFPEPWNRVFSDPLIGPDGEVTEASFGDRLVGLYFSASWCPPCHQFTPLLQRFHQANAEELAVVLVSADNSIPAQLAYMKKYNLPWPAVRYDSDDVERLGTGIGGMPDGISLPTLIVLSPDGRVLDRNGYETLARNASGALAMWKARATAVRATAPAANAAPAPAPSVTPSDTPPAVEPVVETTVGPAVEPAMEPAAVPAAEPVVETAAEGVTPDPVVPDDAAPGDATPEDAAKEGEGADADTTAPLPSPTDAE